ncbi:hypothetical protein EON65_47875 [archaeon]|nr:MAG: hypothetical protein EON65_47875 [archaeon]
MQNFFLKSSSLRYSHQISSSLAQDDKPERHWQGIDYNLSQSLVEKRIKRKASRFLQENRVNIDEIRDSVDYYKSHNSTRHYQAEKNEQNPNEDITASLPSILPSNITPELARLLASDPFVLQLLRDPRMMNMMQAMMQEGQDALKKYLGNPGRLCHLSIIIRYALINKFFIIFPLYFQMPSCCWISSMQPSAKP